VLSISKKKGGHKSLPSPLALLLSSSSDGDGGLRAATSNGKKLSGGSDRKWEGGRWIGWWKGGG